MAGAAAFWAFFGSSTPTSLAARSPTARVWVATLPSASWVSSTAWSEYALDATGGLFEGRLAAQPLEGGLATLDELVVRGLCGLGVALGELAQLVGRQPLTKVAELGRQLFLQLGDAGAGLPDAGLGIGTGIVGTLTQGRDDLVDPLEGQISGADCGKQRGLQVVGGRLGGLGRSSWPWSVFPFQRLRLDRR